MARGGKRKGAGGKKPKLPVGVKKVMYSFRINPELRTWLKKQANQTQTIEEALKAYRAGK